MLAAASKFSAVKDMWKFIHIRRDMYIRTDQERNMKNTFMIYVNSHRNSYLILSKVEMHELIFNLRKKLNLF